MDKWIKSEKEEGDKKEDKKKKKPLKKKPKLENKIQDNETKKTLDKLSKELTKYILICPKKSCGYQKTIRKKQLSDKDKICPRCKGTMKVKK